jgi:hypothetical protein
MLIRQTSNSSATRPRELLGYALLTSAFDCLPQRRRVFHASVMRVAAAHEEPLSDEEAPNVAATDLNDVLLRDSNQPAAPDSLFPLSDSAVVTVHVTQCAAELGVDATGDFTKVSVNTMSLKDVGAELERVQRASGYDSEVRARRVTSAGSTWGRTLSLQRAGTAVKMFDLRLFTIPHRRQRKSCTIHAAPPS